MRRIRSIAYHLRFLTLGVGHGNNDEGLYSMIGGYRCSYEFSCPEVLQLNIESGFNGMG